MRLPATGSTARCLARSGPMRSWRAGTGRSAGSLLMWPCFWSATLAAQAAPKRGSSRGFSWSGTSCCYFVGSVAMRGAGCTYNDLVDHDIDMAGRRARARGRCPPAGSAACRPRPSLSFKRWSASWFCCSSTGSPSCSACCSLAIVALYPFAKRFTDWPQFFLGLAFSWGALMGWAGMFGSLSVRRRPALYRLDRVDDRLRHDLRPSGQGRRRA